MQITTPQFAALASGQVRPISYAMRVAWERTFAPSTKFFTLDVSLLDGSDLLAPSQNNPLQEWDYYAYTNMTDRITSFEVSRMMSFPSSVSSATANFALENHDDALTPGSGSYLSDYILPSRPIRMLSGFKDENLPQFVGLTQGMPEVNETTKEVSFRAEDFLTKILSLKTPASIAMQNVTTDQVLDVLLQGAGLTPSQYDLPKGSNEIKFVFYEKNTDVGNIVDALMEAEMGHLYMDESGIIKFIPRVQNFNATAMTLNESSISEIAVSNANGIINVVEIKAKVREVQVKQPVFTVPEMGGDEWTIPASSSRVLWANLEDPAVSITRPTVGYVASDSHIVASNLSGDVVGGVTVTSDFLFTNSYQFTVANANPFPVNIASGDIWGEPAKVVANIDFEKRDTTSVGKYEEQILRIENDFIQSEDACQSLSLMILDSFAEYAGDINMTVKGSAALQLNDIVDVTKDTFTGKYKVKGITNTILGGQFRQKLNVTRYIERTWFTLDVSLLDGPDQLAP